MAMTVTLPPDMQATLEELIGEFRACDADERQVVIYGTLVALTMALNQYQPLLEKVAKKMNGKRFGQ